MIDDRMLSTCRCDRCGRTAIRVKDQGTSRILLLAPEPRPHGAYAIEEEWGVWRAYGVGMLTPEDAPLYDLHACQDADVEARRLSRDEARKQRGSRQREKVYRRYRN